MIKEFKYTKLNGDTSDRVVYVLKEPSTMLFGLDLTEFDEDERAKYAASLDMLYDDVKDAIKNLGLASQYRNFKEEGIEYED